MRLPKKSPSFLLALIATLVLLSSSICWCALPVDTSQVFGVGARADAMGDAFVAVANDASATFWNPAGLSLLPSSEITTVYKGLAGFSQTSSDAVHLSDFSGELGNTGSTSGDIAGSGLTFVCVTTPLGKGLARKGTLGISRALAGFLDYSVTENIGPIPDTPEFHLDQDQRQEVYYNAVTFGWRSSPRLRYGAGLILADIHGHVTGSVSGSAFGGEVVDPIDDRFSAHAYGANAGVLWSPQITKFGAWTAGASYTSKMRWNWSDAAQSSFGSERPDLLLMGLNFRVPVKDSKTMDQAQWSMQLSRSGSANIGINDGVERHSVWNIAFGGEYEFHRAGKSGMGIYYPVRYGVFTSQSTNKNFGDETWLTFGLGAGRADKLWQGELAYQHAMTTHLSLMSFSGIYRY